MRIDIVTDTFTPDINGVAMTLGKLAHELKSAGHYLTVYHPGISNNDREKHMKSFDLPNYPEVKVGLPATTYWINRWRRKRPDVIYVATESPMGLSALKVANNLQIPSAAGFHTNFHQYIQKYRIRKVEPVALQYLKKAHSKADMTIVPSEGVRTMLSNNGFKNIRVMGRGVDTGMFHPSKRSLKLREQWGATSTDTVLITVGRIAAEKNIELTIKAYQEILLSQPSTKCVLVGDGPIREELERNYPEIIFAGMQTGEELASHYASADILLFPSETETFGNVLLEGKASGLITVAYNYAAAAQHTIHNINGFVAPKGDAEQFIATSLLACNTRSEAISTAAQQTATQLSWKNIGQTLEGYFKEIMKSGKARRRAKDERVPLKVRTLILSDLHLGTEDSKAREVVDVLKHTECEKIILNGDIIDGWALKRGTKWKNTHTRVIRLLLKKMEQEKVEIIYLRGNHDEFLEKFIPLSFSRMKFVKEHRHTSLKGDEYLVIHGDGFDSICAGFKWLEIVGSIGYEALLGFNRFYNRYRAWRGKEYFSLSKVVKNKVKSTLTFVSSYEQKLTELAKQRGCQGIMCGHIHTPANKVIDQIHYMNSGDWVETLSGILERKDGSFEVFSYDEFLQQTSPRLWDEQIVSFPLEPNTLVSEAEQVS